MMGFVTDEMIFWGGMALTGGSLLGLLIFLCISQVKKVRLEAVLDTEYGEQKSK